MVSRVSKFRTCVLTGSALVLGISSMAYAGPLTKFSAGDLVVSEVSSTNGSGLDTASPIVLQEFALSGGGSVASSVGALTLPQSNAGANSAISGEYGSASEGALSLSANGQYLTMMGYGVNADTFNSAPASTYGTAALGQTTSLLAGHQVGTVFTTVPRVVALIDASANVDTTTALTGVFNTNNPRSAATVDGSTVYVSGQGASKTDPTQGVFLATRGATTAIPIETSTDTRIVAINNTGSGNTLYVSRDQNPSGSGSQNFTNVSTLTGPGGVLPTSSTGLATTHIVPPAGPQSSGGNNGSIDLTAALANGVNNSRIGKFVYLSPEAYFFATPDVLYVADSGQPKNGNANKAALGEGGLQKWVNENGTWTLVYDLYAGLNLVNNDNASSTDPTASGVTGLFELTGKVVGDQVELFATSYGLNELSSSYLYEITDDLDGMNPADVSGESFATLASAPEGKLIRGVSFAPVAAVPEPSAWVMLLAGFLTLGGLLRGRRSVAA